MDLETESGTRIDENYIFNTDCTLNAIYEKIPVEEIILDKQEITFTDYNSQKLNVSKILPEEALVNNDDLVFKSDNESVATVNENGDVIPCTTVM